MYGSFVLLEISWFMRIKHIADLHSLSVVQGGSNELSDLKIKILYKKKYFFFSLFYFKNIFEHQDLNFAHPNHK